jgi:hypothetical protein
MAETELNVPQITPNVGGHGGRGFSGGREFREQQSSEPSQMMCWLIDLGKIKNS